jgi:hypothetical protein
MYHKAHIFVLILPKQHILRLKMFLVKLIFKSVFLKKIVLDNVVSMIVFLILAYFLSSLIFYLLLIIINKKMHLTTI